MRQLHKETRRHQAAFTLIELLVVLVILGLLAGLVGPRVLKYLGTAKTDTAQLQIEDLIASIELYHLEVGRFPSTEEGLDALVQKPAGANNWNGPYIKKKNLPTDPWGTPYHYVFPGENGVFDIYSLGQDKATGGDGEAADIVSW
jgi:general secretion pathway protein G